MKNIKYLLSAIFVVNALAGCGAQWNQDPLADKDKALREAQGKPGIPESPKPIDGNNVVVLAEDYTFSEETKGEFNISVRILEEDYVPTLSVENIKDFPGADLSIINYDQQTRMLTAKFTWTPPFGVVSGKTGLKEERDLKLSVVGNKPNSNVIVGHPIVKIGVVKLLNTPEIFSVSNSILVMREGETKEITVKVRDKDARNDVHFAPKLQILPLSHYMNFSQYVSIGSVMALGNDEFAVKLTIDLSDAELTKSRGRFGLALRAVSQFNLFSANHSVQADIYTSFTKPQSTWLDVLEVPLGLKKEFQFMILDPKDEALLETPTFADLPSGATINCRSVGVTIQFCTFSWTPDVSGPAKDYKVRAEVLAKNQDFQDSFTKKFSLDLKLRVISTSPASPLVLQGGK
jgi:hypothetical protein